jgi:hypothetical protein
MAFNSLQQRMFRKCFFFLLSFCQFASVLGKISKSTGVLCLFAGKTNALSIVTKFVPRKVLKPKKTDRRSVKRQHTQKKS